MTSSVGEYYPVRRFRITVASIFIVIILAVIVGLLTHRTISVNHPVWKSSPYGDPRDTASVRAGR
ncbi:MAG: hypothetical protein NTZ35_18215 [Ignavibacteriales bacterium]|nr:hypothetical protein [Ignavibacteriales bacterium]